MSPGVGMQAGLHSIGQLLSLPGDQRPDEAYSRVYTSAPLEEPLAVLGRARAELRVETSASVIGFAVSLCDVAPDGTSALVAKGMRNATRRASLSEPEAIEPAHPSISRSRSTPRAGSSSPATASAWRWRTPTFPTSGRRPSRRPAASIAAARPASSFPSFRSRARWSRRCSPRRPSPSSASRRCIRDRRSARCATRSPVTPASSSTTHSREAIRARPGTSPPPPRSTRAIPRARACAARCRVERRYGALTVDARSQVVVQGSASDFHVVIDVETLVNGHPHFTRRWVETIPRTLL